MTDLLPGQEVAIDNARLAWYDANAPTWVCQDCKDKVVEYAPEFAGDPCDHTAYCAGCVDEYAARPCDAEFDFGKRVEFEVEGCYSKPRLRHTCYASGPGAQSYAAHVAARTI